MKKSRITPIIVLAERDLKHEYSLHDRCEAIAKNQQNFFKNKQVDTEKRSSSMFSTIVNVMIPVLLVIAIYSLTC